MISPSQRLFVRSENLSLHHDARLTGAWFTWSNEARETLLDLAQALPSLPKPEVKYFEESEYGYSVAIAARHFLSPNLRRRLDHLAAAFLDIRSFSEIVFLDKMLDKQVSGNCIASFFAWVRSTLTESTGERDAAIFAPLGAVGGTTQGNFPLHADLYAPMFLLNLFDHVPPDGSGASLFLCVAEFFTWIDNLPAVPVEVRRRIRSLLVEPTDEDHYEELYDLLHGEHPWTTELESWMAERASRVSLRRGQGYLIHDRCWLHGREAPSRRVRKNRLHRLIFDSRNTLKARTDKRSHSHSEEVQVSG